MKLEMDSEDTKGNTEDLAPKRKFRLVRTRSLS